MMKKNMFSFLFIVMFVVISLIPFYYLVNADGQFLFAPFIGVNVNAFDNENNVRYTFSGSPSIESDGRHDWYCKTWNSNHTCDLYSNVYPNGTIQDHDYNIVFNNVRLNPSIISNSNIYELDFVLDNEYSGWFQLSYTNKNGGITDGILVNVNGTHAIYRTDNIDISQDISVYGVNLKSSVNNQWTFPFESMSTIKELYDNGFQQVGINSTNNVIFPIFKQKTGINMNNQAIGNNVEYVICMFTSGSTSNVSGFNNLYQYNSNITIKNYEVVFSSTAGRILKITFTNTDTNNNQRLQLQCKTTNQNFTIFFGSVKKNYYPISTDLALLCGLQNELLYNLEILAHGNNNSTQSSQSADSINNQAENTFDTEHQLVNNAEQDLSTNLQVLDIQNQNNNLFGNSKFIASAQWVKQQFDYFTNNNAYGYLITFSLVIGIALVIIGKLRG